LGSKASALATPSQLDQFRPKLKVWTPTRLNLMALRLFSLLVRKENHCFPRYSPLSLGLVTQISGSPLLVHTPNHPNSSLVRV